MTELDLLLKDKNGKKVKLLVLATLLNINPEKLYRCIYSGDCWNLEKAYYYSIVSKLKGYDFPVEMFLSYKQIDLLNKALGIKIEKYNPLS